MPSMSEWKVPPAFQPRAAEYGFDLERVLSSIVGLHSIIPQDAFTAETLGTERAGNGVVIDDGLVLTIGYLITEAEPVWLHLGDGRVMPAHALGFDAETGFGLVQALGRMKSIRCRSAARPRPRSATAWWSAAPAGRTRSVASQIAAKQEFAGYWEYLLDEAIFTHPAHPNWGGAGVISSSGELIGIGSLQLERERGGKAEHVNMIVPIDLLEARARRSAPLRQGQQAGAALARHVFGRDRQPRRRDRHFRQRTGGARRAQGRRRDPRGQGREDHEPGRLLPEAVGARAGRRRRAADRAS